MSRRTRASDGPAAIDLLEEGIQVLRAAPPGLLALWCLATVPFVLGFLHFWIDMRTSAFARDHAGAAALRLGLLYLWMKCGQALFARGLRRRLSGDQDGGLERPGWLRPVIVQSGLQPISLFALPLAALAVLPLGWVIAWFHHLSVHDDPAQARRQAAMWPLQNHALLGFLVLFAGCVFLNWAMVIATLPWIVKWLFGIESLFTRSPTALFNTTFFVLAAGLTYLVVGPIVKAAYVLRGFYGDSLESGEDLKSDLRRILAGAGRAAVVVALLLPVAVSAAAQGADPGGPPAPAGVSAAALDEAIDAVVARPEFRWRLPREEPPEEDDWIVGRFFDSVASTLMGWARAIGDLFEPLLRWLGDLFGKSLRRAETDAMTDSGYRTTVQVLAIALLMVLAATAGVAGWRLLRRWRDDTADEVRILSKAVALPADDSAAAEQSADEWEARARGLAARGDLRQAVRALYLAGLSHLGDRGLITLVRSRSNRDYARELGRKARDRPELQALFDEGIAVFERVWYGTHAVTGATLQACVDRTRRMRSCVP